MPGALLQLRSLHLQPDKLPLFGELWRLVDPAAVGPVASVTPTPAGPPVVSALDAEAEQSA